MRVAMPVWSDRISPVFDVAQRLLVVELDGGSEQGREEMPLTETDPFRRTAALGRANVNVLICGGISRPLEQMLVASGVEVIAQTCGPVEAVLGAFQSGELSQPRFLMPGCCGRRRFRGGRGFGGGWASAFEGNER